ncbi:MAG: translation elongation factor Ts, partial [bacterium]|nr:translation elongation factor Ts [bacterium]
ERTGAGMMDCKRALVEMNGELEKAIEFLREKGLAAANKKAGRITSEGIVEAYIHGAGRIGVLVEVNCETDFVAKNESFRSLARDIAMQIAAANPQFISRDEISADTIEKEREIFRAQALNEGKPEKIVDKMVEGRLEKFFAESCLLEQPYIRETELTVKEYIQARVANLGENITVRRFSRFHMGEGLSKRTE